MISREASILPCRLGPKHERPDFLVGRMHARQVQRKIHQFSILRQVPAIWTALATSGPLCIIEFAG